MTTFQGQVLMKSHTISGSKISKYKLKVCNSILQWLSVGEHLHKIVVWQNDLQHGTISLY